MIGTPSADDRLLGINSLPRPPWKRHAQLGQVVLDLIAAPLGGTTAQLPVYARDILHAGSIGLGLLRSAPAVGAFANCALPSPVSAEASGQQRAVCRRRGLRAGHRGVRALHIARALPRGSDRRRRRRHGERQHPLIRSSLVQLATPDALRGRVSAVNMLFVGTSSELGAFESGILASLIGTVPCVIAGGIGALIAAGPWMRPFPTLRQADRLPYA